MSEEPQLILLGSVLVRALLLKKLDKKWNLLVGALKRGDGRKCWNSDGEAIAN